MTDADIASLLYHAYATTSALGAGFTTWGRLSDVERARWIVVVGAARAFFVPAPVLR